MTSPAPRKYFAGAAVPERNGTMSFRIGHGYDVHRFDDSRTLILGGIHIPNHAGLLGHSDADVLTHAVMDALLGAAGLRDIGHYFPDSDEQYAGADSMKLASIVAGMLTDKGFRTVNVDCTVIAQSPKLSPYIADMKRSVASALGVNSDAVNIKTTTEEGLGFTGAKLGIAAHAVALIESI